MAKYKARVQETTNITGTVPAVLGGATSGYQRFQDAFSDGDWVHYLIESEDRTQYERGYGLFNLAGNSISRAYPKEPVNLVATSFNPGNHLITASPNPDFAHPGGWLIRYPETEDAQTGVALQINWDIGTPQYDTDNVWDSILFSRTCPIADWVDKIRVSVGVMIAENATGSRRLWLEGAQRYHGLPQIDFPGHLTNSSFQYLGFSSGIIDVELQLQQREFSIWIQQDSGGPLEVRGAGPTTGFLLCEYVE